MWDRYAACNGTRNLGGDDGNWFLGQTMKQFGINAKEVELEYTIMPFCDNKSDKAYVFQCSRLPKASRAECNKNTDVDLYETSSVKYCKGKLKWTDGRHSRFTRRKNVCVLLQESYRNALSEALWKRDIEARKRCVTNERSNWKTKYLFNFVSWLDMLCALFMQTPCCMRWPF